MIRQLWITAVKSKDPDTVCAKARVELDPTGTYAQIHIDGYLQLTPSRVRKLMPEFEQVCMMLQILKCKGIYTYGDVKYARLFGFDEWFTVDGVEYAYRSLEV